MDTKKFKELETYCFIDEFSGKKHLFTVISITKLLGNKRGSIKIKYNERIQECLLYNNGELECMTPIINTPTAIVVTSKDIYKTGLNSGKKSRQ